MSIFKFGAASEARLKGVHPTLVKVIRRALAYGILDFTVAQGVRTKEEQAELYARGRTKPGPVVTWTLDSNHLPQADGYGHAVDLVPFPIDWNDNSRFFILNGIMRAAAAELGVKLRTGCDWDSDGQTKDERKPDLPHYELP